MCSFAFRPEIEQIITYGENYEAQVQSEKDEIIEIINKTEHLQSIIIFSTLEVLTSHKSKLKRRMPNEKNIYFFPWVCIVFYRVHITIIIKWLVYYRYFLNVLLCDLLYCHVQLYKRIRYIFVFKKRKISVWPHFN